MSQNIGVPELPNLFSALSARFPENSFLKFIYLWENVSYSLIIVLVLGILAFLPAGKKA